MQYLIHMDFVNDDWVVMVERTKLAMMESLPMAMQQKKFGTWGKCFILCIVNFKTTFIRNWEEPCCSIKKQLVSVTCHACMLNLIIESMHWFMYYETCALLKVTFRQMGLCVICNYFHSCDNECIHTHFLSMCLYNFMYIHVHVLII